MMGQGSSVQDLQKIEFQITYNTVYQKDKLNLMVLYFYSVTTAARGQRRSGEECGMRAVEGRKEMETHSTWTPKSWVQPSRRVILAGSWLTFNLHRSAVFAMNYLMVSALGIFCRVIMVEGQQSGSKNWARDKGESSHCADLRPLQEDFAVWPGQTACSKADPNFVSE